MNLPEITTFGQTEQRYLDKEKRENSKCGKRVRIKQYIMKTCTIIPILHFFSCQDILRFLHSQNSHNSHNFHNRIAQDQLDNLLCPSFLLCCCFIGMGSYSKKNSSFFSEKEKSRMTSTFPFCNSNCEDDRALGSCISFFYGSHKREEQIE